MTSLSTVGGELVLAVEHVVVGDDLAGVGGHAAHRGDEAGLRAALDLVVRLVLADGADQVFPFEVVGVRLRLRIGPEQVLLRGSCCVLLAACAGVAVNFWPL